MNNILKLFSFLVIFTCSIYGQQTEKAAINFQAVVGDKVFDCRETYNGIGTTNSRLTVTDFKFFVHNVRFVDKKGKETSVNLTSDGRFQTEKVALLDFENGAGNCEKGTKELNTIIRGTVPKGNYVGLRFTIGVPVEENHADPTLQSSPLNMTRMMWSWQSGYKFIRIDTKTTGRPNGYVLHLGSTNCETDDTGKTKCCFPNRPEFSFDKFDLQKDVIIVDLKQLYLGANVDINQEKTAAGCMSSQDDADCKPVFDSLGLSFDGKPAVRETFLRVGKAVKSSRKNAE